MEVNYLCSYFLKAPAKLLLWAKLYFHELISSSNFWTDCVPRGYQNTSEQSKWDPGQGEWPRGLSWLHWPFSALCSATLSRAAPPRFFEGQQKVEGRNHPRSSSHPPVGNNVPVAQESQQGGWASHPANASRPEPPRACGFLKKSHQSFGILGSVGDTTHCDSGLWSATTHRPGHSSGSTGRVHEGSSGRLGRA